MATHFSILDGRIPWIEEPGVLCSPWCRKGLDVPEATSHAHGHISFFGGTFPCSLTVNSGLTGTYGSWKLLFIFSDSQLLFSIYKVSLYGRSSVDNCYFY